MKLNKGTIIGGLLVLLVLAGGIFAPDLEEEDSGSVKEGAELNKEEFSKEGLNRDKVVAVTKEVEEPIGRDGEIRKLVTEIHDDKYLGSEVGEIEVNENLGLNDGSYVVLAHFSFTRANSAEKTLNFVSKYSEDLAARLAETVDISAVTVFYEAPRFLESGNVTKYTYKRSGDTMVLDNKFVSTELK